MKRILTITPTNITISPTDSNRILSALESFHACLTCTSVTVDKLTNLNVSPRQYLYKITTHDGRIWKQTIICDSNADPLMTFVIADQWRLSEFSNQRNLRDVLILLVNTYPTLEKLTYTFT